MTTQAIYGAADQKPNDEKLRELIIYIALECEGDDKFGAVKLNKLLFYADFEFYVRYGRSITGQNYQALPQGPAPYRLIPIRRDMESGGDIVVVQRDYYGLKQERVVPRRGADLERFTAQEIALVDRLIRENWPWNATEISDRSHLFLGWRLATEGDTIPYNVALIDRRGPTPYEMRYGLELESLALEALGHVNAR